MIKKSKNYKNEKLTKNKQHTGSLAIIDLRMTEHHTGVYPLGH